MGEACQRDVLSLRPANAAERAPFCLPVAQKQEKSRRELGPASREGGDLDENFIRLYWEQMLQVRSVCVCARVSVYVW